jgi:hypothetical protein
MPETLVLRAITWRPNRPSALINDQTFEVNEEGKVRMGKTNVVIRCVAIHEDLVLVEFVGSGQKQELRLRAK